MGHTQTIHSGLRAQVFPPHINTGASGSTYTAPGTSSSLFTNTAGLSFGLQRTGCTPSKPSAILVPDFQPTITCAPGFLATLNTPEYQIPYTDPNIVSISQYGPTQAATSCTVSSSADLTALQLVSRNLIAPEVAAKYMPQDQCEQKSDEDPLS